MAESHESLKLVKELSRPEIVLALAHVPGGRRVIFGGSDFHVYDLDLSQEKPEPRKLGGHDSFVSGLAIAGGAAISGGYDGRLIWWDLDSGARLRTVEAHTKWIRAVAAAADGTLLASVADDMVCRLWDAGTGSLRHELTGHAAITPHHFPSMLYACTFSPDGQFVATGDKVGHVAVWEAAAGRQVATLEAPVMYTWDPVQRRHSIGGIRALAFSPDGQRLAIGGMGKVGNIDHLDGLARVEVFDWRKAERTHELAGEALKGLVERLLFLPGGEHLLALGGSNDGFIMKLDLKSKTATLAEKVPLHIHDAALCDPPGTFLVAGHGKVAVYEING